MNGETTKDGDAMKHGDIVRYSNPGAGEEGFRFVVLEAFEQRVTMKVLNSGFRIEPIETVLQTDVWVCADVGIA